MKNVEDLYPLTPMQQAMLLRVRGGGDSSSLFQQFDYEWQGPLNPERFEASWRHVIARHPGLRTAFVFEGLEQPLQIVRETVSFDVDFRDWRSTPAADHERELTVLKGEDRAEPLVLKDAPLMRVKVIRTGDDRWTILWSSHHLVLDRWCIAVILTDFTEHYSASGSSPGSSMGTPPGTHAQSAAPGRFRDYVAWMAQQDKAKANRYWRDSLAGLHVAERQVTRATGQDSPEGLSSNPPERAVLRWDAAATERLRVAARSHGATPNALVQIAWAATIAAVMGRHSVAYGVTVAGRPHDVPGVENAVGTFIGNVPVFARLGSHATAAAAIESLMRIQRDRSGYEYLSPAELHFASRLDAAEPLFDSLFVWLSNAEWEGPPGVSITQGAGALATELPLTVGASESQNGLELSLSLRAGYRLARDLGGASRADSLERWLGKFSEIAAALVDGASLPGLVGEAESEADRADGESQAVWSMDLPAETAGLAPSTGREKNSIEMVQAMLDEECRRLLGVCQVDRTLGFFEQGGNSLRAAALHARLEAATGRAIPILELFGTGSLAAMAHRIHAGSWPVSTQVVRPVRPSGTKPPLVCVSSPEVNSVGYVNLARHLPADQPVLLAQGPPGTDVVFRMAISDIPKIAEQYVDAILNSVPDISDERPLRLLGMCDGALLSMEMARILTDRGVPIDFVGSLNSFALGTLTWRFKLRRVGSRIRYYRTRVRQMLGKAPTLEDEAPSELSGAQTPEEGILARQDRKQHTKEHLADINEEWFTLDTPAGIGTPDRWNGTVTLFRIRPQPYWRVRTKTLGWERHAANVRVVRLEDFQSDRPSSRHRHRHEIHLDMLREPDVQRTARAIESVLADLDALRQAPVQDSDGTPTDAPSQAAHTASPDLGSPALAGTGSREERT